MRIVLLAEFSSTYSDVQSACVHTLISHMCASCSTWKAIFVTLQNIQITEIFLTVGFHNGISFSTGFYCLSLTAGKINWALQQQSLTVFRKVNDSHKLCSKYKVDYCATTWAFVCVLHAKLYCAISTSQSRLSLGWWAACTDALWCSDQCQ